MARGVRFRVRNPPLGCACMFKCESATHPKAVKIEAYASFILYTRRCLATHTDDRPPLESAFANARASIYGCIRIDMRMPADQSKGTFTDAYALCIGLYD